MKINWKKLFDWSVDCVGGPGETYDKYGRVRGYKVVVKYTHHGSDELFFDMEDEHLWTQYGSPEEAAKQTVKFYQDKIAKQRKMQLARQK